MTDAPNRTAATLAQIAPLGLPPEQGFVATANKLLGWSIDSNGGAYLNEAGVDRVDRLVAALIRIRDGGAPAEFEAIARKALL